MHGLDNEVAWSEVIRPVGPQPLPNWVKGVHVDWLDQYSNIPRVRLKVRGEVRDWDEKVFRKQGALFIADHADGRAEVFGHGGAVGLDTIKMFRGEDGVLRQHPRSGAQWYEPRPGVRMFPPHGYEPGAWEEVLIRCTTKDRGFGGAHIHLMMDDGEPLVLRGPWHVGAPSGYVEVSYVDTTSRYFRFGKQVWHRQSGRAGLYIKEELFVAILSTFLAHLRLMKVTRYGRSTIEPIKPEWDAPKCIMQDRERKNGTPDHNVG